MKYNPKYIKKTYEEIYIYNLFWRYITLSTYNFLIFVDLKTKSNRFLLMLKGASIHKFLMPLLRFLKVARISLLI